MTNRISGYNAPELSVPVKGAPVADEAGGASKPAAASAVSTADTVSITGSALTLQKLSEAVAKSPGFNAQNVATVKQAIQNGTYQVDGGRVADQIIQAEREL